jgi:hypothetical protein
MSAQGGGIPRFNPEVNVNFRAIPSFTPQAPAQNAQLFGQLSNVFNGILDKVVDVQAQRVKLEAGKAGTQAGAQPGFDATTLPEEATIAAQAYRQSALESFASQLELDRDQKFASYQLEYEKLPEAERDPARLQAQFQGYIQGVAEKLPTELRAPYMQMAVNKANPVVLQANRQYLATQQAAAQANNQAAVQVLKKQLMDNPLPANEVEQKAYDTSLAQLSQAMKSAGYQPNEQTLVLEELRDHTVKVTKERTEQGFLSEFENAPDKLAYFEKFTQAKPGALGLDTETQNKLSGVMQADIEDQDWAEKQRHQELSFEQKLTLDLKKQAIEDGIKDGSVSKVALTRFIAEHQDNIDSGWAATQLTNWSKTQKALVEKNQKIQDLMSGNVLMSPDDPETQDLVDEAAKRLTGLVSPVAGAKITGVYEEDRGDHKHGGVDLAAPNGSAIRAMRGGKVTFVGTMKGFGNTVKIQMDDGYTMLVGHNSANKVKLNQRVEAGDVVALVGSQGRSTGPHAHVEIFDKKGQRVNPQEYMGQQKKALGMSEEQAMRHLILKSGVVPTVYKNKMLAMLHGDVKQQAEAAGIYGWMLDQDVEVKGVSERDRGLLARIDAELRRNVPPDKAVMMAREALNPGNENKILGDQERVKQWLKEPGVQIENLLTENQGWFNGSAQAPNVPVYGGALDNMKADWKAFLEKAGAETGGDKEASVKLALKDFKKLYGWSGVSGTRQYIKYAPEKFYGIRGYSRQENTEWIQEQLYQDYKGDLPKGVDKSRLMIAPHRYTGRQAATGRPGYSVFYKNTDGRIVQLMESNGKESIFWPDPQKKIQQERLKAQREAQKKAAKEMALMKELRQTALKAQPKPFNMLGK